MVQNELKQWLLPKRAFGDCFGCAPHNTKGLNLQFWYTEKGCISYDRVPKEFCGFTGLTHGGIIATLLDEVAAWTVITHLYQIGITIQATVNYLKPVPTEEPLIIEGEITKKSGEHVETLAKVSSKKGLLLAQAESKWLIPSNSLLSKITGLDQEEIERLISTTVEEIKKLKQESQKAGAKNLVSDS